MSIIQNDNWTTRLDTPSMTTFLSQIESEDLRIFTFAHFVSIQRYRLQILCQEYWRFQFWCPNGPGMDNTILFVDRTTPEEAAQAAFVEFCKHRMKG